jgi:hypothetical protein
MDNIKKTPNLHIAGASIESKLAFMKSSKTWNSNLPISDIRETMNGNDSLKLSHI